MVGGWGSMSWSEVNPTAVHLLRCWPRVLSLRNSHLPAADEDQPSSSPFHLCEVLEWELSFKQEIDFCFTCILYQGTSESSRGVAKAVPNQHVR